MKDKGIWRETTIKMKNWKRVSECVYGVSIEKEITEDIKEKINSTTCLEISFSGKGVHRFARKREGKGKRKGEEEQKWIKNNDICIKG